jgi:hypothetical protein
MRNQPCQITIRNNSTEVINVIGGKFLYDDNSTSYDPPDLATHGGGKKVTIKPGETGTLVGEPKKCCVLVSWFAMTDDLTAGGDSPHTPSGACFVNPVVDFPPRIMLAKGAKADLAATKKQ